MNTNIDIKNIIVANINFGFFIVTIPFLNIKVNLAFLQLIGEFAVLY